MKKPATLRDYSEEVYAAKERYYDAIRATFLVNALVHVTSGDRETPVFVTGTYRDRVDVANPDTGKSYSVYAFRLREHDTWAAPPPRSPHE